MNLTFLYNLDVNEHEHKDVAKSFLGCKQKK